MILIALTGSIASGKSTVVGWLKELGLAVDDADAHVHHMFSSNTHVIQAIGDLWPECIVNGRVDRSFLRKQVIGNHSALKQLEQITHPVVRQMSRAYLDQCKKKAEPAVFLDIPLLFESNSPALYDSTLVVYCSPENQRIRAIARGTPEDVFEYLLSQQVPLSQKLANADFTLNTDGNLAETRQKLLEVIQQIEHKYHIQLIKD